MFRRVLLTAAVSAPFLWGALGSGAFAASTNYTARLSAAREIPKTDSKGTGTFSGTYDTAGKTLTYTLTFENLTGPATGAHLHGPATRTQSAGVLAPLGDKNPTSPVTGTLTLNDDQVKALQGGKTYVNIHTAANPNGEIRGQVVHAAQKKTAAKKPAA